MRITFWLTMCVALHVSACDPPIASEPVPQAATPVPPEEPTPPGPPEEDGDWYEFTVDNKDFALETFGSMAHRLGGDVELAGSVRASGDLFYLDADEDGVMDDDESPIRFWGTNLARWGAYPDATTQLAIVNRLAKMGMNLVRFHWIDYGRSNSDRPDALEDQGGIWCSCDRALDPVERYTCVPLTGDPDNADYYADACDNGLDCTASQFCGLDRKRLEDLNHFVRELGKNGIYSNMNLLTGWIIPKSVDFQILWDQHAEALGLPERPGLVDLKGQLPSRSRYLPQIHPIAALTLQAYATRLLTHRPTDEVGSLVEKRALAQVETINENNLFSGWAGGCLRHRSPRRDVTCPDYPIADVLLETLQARWIDYLLTKYPAPGELEQAWADDDGRIAECEELDGKLQDEWSGGVPVRLDLLSGELARNCLPAEDAPLADSRRLLDTWAFIEHVEREFYEELAEVLREDAGVNALLTGSQFMGVGAPTLKTREAMDYTDTHGYWNHAGPTAEVPQRSLLALIDGIEDKRNGGRIALPDKEGSATPILRYARNKVRGKPMTVSEHNTAFPSEQRFLLPVLLASYGGFQEWAAVEHFRYFAVLDDWKAGPLTDHFGLSRNTMDQILLAVAGLVFTRGDVSPGDDDQRVCIPYQEEDEQYRREAIAAAYQEPFDCGDDSSCVLDPDYAHYELATDEDTMHRLPYLHRVERALNGECAGPAPGPVPTERRYVSDTGQLTIDRTDPDRVLFSVDTERTAIVAGHLSQRSDVKLARFGVESSTDGVVILTSMDGKPLRTSQSALLVALSDQYVVDATYELMCEEQITEFTPEEPLYCEWPKKTHWRIANPGADDGTTLLRKMDTRIKIRVDKLPNSALRRPCVYPLDPTGADAGEPLKIERTGNTSEWQLDISDAESPWFRIQTVDLNQPCP